MGLGNLRSKTRVIRNCALCFVCVCFVDRDGSAGSVHSASRTAVAWRGEGYEKVTVAIEN